MTVCVDQIITPSHAAKAGGIYERSQPLMFILIFHEKKNRGKDYLTGTFGGKEVQERIPPGFQRWVGLNRHHALSHRCVIAVYHLAHRDSGDSSDVLSWTWLALGPCS
jgi:hypothetical protein